MYNSQNIKFSLLTILLSVYCTYAFSQDSPGYYSYPYNHLPWYTIESEHFLVHFQEGNSRSAQVASRIAEEVYPHITQLYDSHSDSKTSIVLKDREDYSNGAAYFFDNQIDIWIPALNTPLRGTHNWLRDVISHEFTHIIQLQTAMKKSRTLPAIYFQWLSYEDVRRPDVLYGYPNGLLTYPFSSVSVPAWFAEGVAQYQRTGWTYDTWDTHRDMVLRMAMLNNTYLSFEEMGTFTSKTGIERETVYNQGFAFSIYLAQRFGESVFKKISTTLSKSGFNDIGKAIKDVTGTGGRQLFKKWVSDQKKFYAEAVQNIETGNSTIIEQEGFFNFYPVFSPDGSKVAYLSNKNRTESGVSLYLKEADSTEKGLARIDLGRIGSHYNKSLSCGFEERPLINRIRTAFSFSPDGNRLIFTKTKLNKYGEDYNDLFIYHFDSKKVTRLTQSSRIHDPAWKPDGKQIAAVQIDAGTANLVLVDPTDGSVRKLTRFEDGEQIYTPTWHPDGDAIYFSFSQQHGRSIRRLALSNNKIQTIFKKPYTDYRDPFIDKQGLFLYYASDKDGIFNIYRASPKGENEQKLTNVQGGAFMPNLNSESEMIYSEYRKGGYKIVSKSIGLIAGQRTVGSYQPQITAEANISANITNYDHLNSYDDSDIDPLDEAIISKADTGSITIRIPTINASDERSLYGYEEEFTKFSFYPVIRFDNYSKFNGSNTSLLKAGNFGKLGENLIRDMKLGTYVISREVTGRMNIFGGALFGFGSRSADGIGDFFKPSRLTDLDRDLFLITEYRGLPFIEKRWSPTISLEFYNLRRNVSNGLSVEEFQCTSCLPDTTLVDIAYNIWEADLYLRSKINAFSMVELGVGYTPYRVQTEGFFSRELEQFISSSSTEYFRGTTFNAAYIYENFNFYPHSDAAPIGLRTKLRYAYQPSKLLENFEVEDGMLSPVYRSSGNHSVELNGLWGFELGDNSTGQFYSRFFSYLNQPDDFFYLDYIGGFTGMRSYPFFSIGGNTTAFSRFSYIFPVITEINEQIGRHTLDKLFVRLFAEAGNGWQGPNDIGSYLKTGVGAELRFAFNSYYLYPLKFFVSGAYGFSEFGVNLPSDFITETGTNNVTYGRELIFHFGLTFDFEILNND